jgi:hypothetical protein
MTDKRVSQLTSEIETTREEFSGLISELERRRREATDVKLQARRHPGVAGGIAAFVVVAIALLATRKRRRRRRLADPEQRRRVLDQALDRMLEHPEKAGMDARGALVTLALTAGTAFVSTLARRAAQNAVLPQRRSGRTDGSRHEPAGVAAVPR